MTTIKNMFAVVWVVNEVRLRLARALLTLIENDARWMRWIALGLFVGGSLLNLIASI